MNENITEFNNAQADGEGWGIFDCVGSDNGRWQLQRIDEDEVFLDDDSAWKFVTDKAREGSAYHRSAIEFVRDNNPDEYQAIRTATGFELEAVA
ncbi:hypothetical protein WS89_22565 [Burkholderia sp. MSMB1072]|uniref:hypothetical protein n=1 Tax=Burkholderia sp. MSMB1072 TaxID=1637871 RepID=UPI00075D7E79|nr:hypothetical protein [Burkholderia sp. MSMB1072]KVH56764.1 hypothetical protein WS89_22565 [Burkholderia sp. MSMB1072]